MAVLIGLTATSEGMAHGGTSSDFSGLGVRPPLFLVSQDYCKAIIRAGGIPVLLPPLEEAEIPHLFETLGGLLFTGGVDIDPQTYGESPHPLLGDVDAERDRFELALMRYALSHTDVPVLGVCRGLQLLNVALGGTLWQDLPSQRPSHVHHSQRDHRYKAVHPVRLAPDSTLASLLPRVLAVNSLHHQGIRDLAPGLRPAAWSPDGVVEAAEVEGHPFRVAVQWHPENLAAASYPEFIALFERLIEEAARRARARTAADPTSGLGAFPSRG